MLEEAAMDQADYQDDRDDDEDYDLEEQDYSVTMSDQSMCTIKSVAQEEVMDENNPQKPSESALNPKPSSKSHSHNSQNL
jgi:hypothetical protein